MGFGFGRVSDEVVDRIHTAFPELFICVFVVDRKKYLHSDFTATELTQFILNLTQILEKRVEEKRNEDLDRPATLRACFDVKENQDFGIVTGALVKKGNDELVDQLESFLARPAPEIDLAKYESVSQMITDSFEAMTAADSSAGLALVAWTRLSRFIELQITRQT